MGSNPNNEASQALILTNPTPAERTATWASTHQQWGFALDLEVYLRREAYLQTVPMSRNGGITQWILTDPSLPADARPVLSSCESIRKRCLVASPDGSVREGVAHGIASVFTEPPHRGHGYASRMMALLGPRLATWQGRNLDFSSSSSSSEKNGSGGGRGSPPGGGAGDVDREVAFSVLFSDIGKSFYAKNGWPAYESSHLSFTPMPPDSVEEPSSSASESKKLRPLGYHELAELCSLDESLLRARLSRPLDSSSSSQKTRVALVPDLDAILWHLMREDFMTKHIFGSTPQARGAVYGEPGQRVWAVWTRGYYGGLKRPEGNTLHILRLVIEDQDTCGEDYLAEGIAAVLGLARKEAAEWKVNNVEMWNPSSRVRGLVERAGVSHEFVEREKDSIASLMWYGEGEVEWVLNEKFGWC